ncbi:stage II sporulation protein E [Kineococcus xinjiangensis]|uniref:Stage II sporulation protein E n=1 Tax=Kineococcus xinjiangensis TaxID=512762 RepID=A0A2S6IJ74_9ACTN|nr:PP2C family protein-serine/threonine phosphatase [Kineococcus xinjiangensis]PPK94248.1 stage II sporulation protein E [Kineococcus xinjiangensis]
MGDSRPEDPHAVVLEMLNRAHTLPPWLLATWVERYSHRIGATSVRIYLNDYEQRALMPLTVSGEAPDAVRPVPVDGTPAGRAFAHTEQVEALTPGDGRLWTPMIDGADRLGVVELGFPEVDEDTRELARRFTDVVTVLLISKGGHTDVYFRARRNRAMTLPAEMQWHLLPPLTVVDPRVALTGVVEPSYEVGGDAFDYAINHGTAHLAIFDAMGHGLSASVMSAVAVGAYRHARRAGVPVEKMYSLIDAEFSREFGAERFVTAQLADLDLATGCLRLVNAGHPAPLLVRGSRVVDRLSGPATLPIGLGGTEPDATVWDLQPGDMVLLYTDGVVEARRHGDEFGEERFVDLVEQEVRTGLPLPEVLRRINLAALDWAGSELRDDATMLLVEWRSPDLPPY